MRLLAGFGIASFWIGLAFWAWRALTRDAHVPHPEFQKRWKKLPAIECGIRPRYEGDPTRHQMRRVQ
jgi:hypothetical protein